MLKYLVYSAVNNVMHKPNIIALLEGLTFITAISTYKKKLSHIRKKSLAIIILIFFLSLNFFKFLAVSVAKL